ncbi:hypothetical protein [Nocardiopsis potens]|uniref:hypothetical protein n=1 Tax=Nocardiopsis potens TaxID=1246458 RepID=UPI00034AF9FC|nr:hypothetical protein [Nocardiopsis potens]
MNDESGASGAGKIFLTLGLLAVLFVFLIAACSSGGGRPDCGDYDLVDGRYVYNDDRGDYEYEDGEYIYVGCRTTSSHGSSSGSSGGGWWFFGGGDGHRNGSGYRGGGPGWGK